LSAFHSTLTNLPFAEGSLTEFAEVVKAGNFPVFLLWGDMDRVVNYLKHPMILPDAETQNRVKFVTVKDAGYAYSLKVLTIIAMLYSLNNQISATHRWQISYIQLKHNELQNENMCINICSQGYQDYIKRF
jgi:hypothetical protein